MHAREGGGVSTSLSHFHDWIDYNGVAFFNGVTTMGSHIFRDFGCEESLVYRDLKMGRFTVKKLSPYFALLFNNRFALEVCPSPPPPTRAARSRFKRSIKEADDVLLKQRSTDGQTKKLIISHVSNILWCKILI